MSRNDHRGSAVGPRHPSFAAGPRTPATVRQQTGELSYLQLGTARSPVVRRLTREAILQFASDSRAFADAARLGAPKPACPRRNRSEAADRPESSTPRRPRPLLCFPGRTSAARTRVPEAIPMRSRSAWTHAFTGPPRIASSASHLDGLGGPNGQPGGQYPIAGDCGEVRSNRAGDAAGDLGRSRAFRPR